MRVGVEHGLSNILNIQSIHFCSSFLVQIQSIGITAPFWEQYFDLKGKEGKLELAVEEEEGYVYRWNQEWKVTHVSKPAANGEGGVSQRAPLKQFQPEYNPDLQVENQEGERKL